MAADGARSAGRGADRVRRDPVAAHSAPDLGEHTDDVLQDRARHGRDHRPQGQRRRSLTSVDAGTDTIQAESSMVSASSSSTGPTAATHRTRRCRRRPRPARALQKDDDVGCVLLAGAGRHSSLVATSRWRRPGQPEFAGRRRLHPSARAWSKFIAATGAAAGAGLGIALAPDLRVAAASAKLVTSYITLAFSGDFAATWFLTRMLGPPEGAGGHAREPSMDADRAAVGSGQPGRARRGLRDTAIAWHENRRRDRRARTLIKENVTRHSRCRSRSSSPAKRQRMGDSAQTDDHRQARQRWWTR